MPTMPSFRIPYKAGNGEKLKEYTLFTPDCFVRGLLRQTSHLENRARPDPPALLPSGTGPAGGRRGIAHYVVYANSSKMSLSVR